jgi:DNA topoisomerase-1
MGKTLVIVESSGKIGKIGAILGNDYIVMASGGHIIDLDPSCMSIDFTKNFEPQYCIIKDKHTTVARLKKAYADASDVLLAADEDREGEMIAWSLAKELKISKPKRIVFNSITKNEILHAVKNPQKINDDYVNAQQMRRLLDRLVGYRISPLLWKNIGDPSLSAGRVQSVVLKLIVEKEESIVDFFEHDTSTYFKFVGSFRPDNKNKKEMYKAKLFTTKKQQIMVDSDDDSPKKKSESDGDEEHGYEAKINGLSEAQKLMKRMIKSTFKIMSVTNRESFRYPSPPFETSSLQQEASNKLGMTSKRTMTAAQHLYEAGHITYMRTDSISLSDEALVTIGKFVVSKYGKEFYRKMQYKSKSKVAQEAHEAVRVCDVNTKSVQPDEKSKIGNDEIRLYNLIWKRTVASQMSPAKFNVITIKIEISDMKDYYFATVLEDMLFAGFLSVYNIENIEKGDEAILESSNKMVLPEPGTKVFANDVTATQEYQRPPMRYNDASLVKKLKSLDIGRPATYTSLIDKIQMRNYVVKENIDGMEKESITISWNGTDANFKENTQKIMIGKEKNKFVPTSVGKIVAEFLTDKFPEIMKYKFTAEMEKQLDEIANGKLKWKNALKQFYDTFSPLVDAVSKTLVPKILMDKHARELGLHPETKKMIVATIAKYGPIVKIIDTEKKTICAPIKKPLTLEKITLEDALELFEWPKTLGTLDKKKITLNRGKYGYYLKIGCALDAKVISLGTDDNVVLPNKSTKDINEFDIDDAKLFVDEQQKNILWEGSDKKYKYTALIGPYGTYVRCKPDKGKIINVTVPKDLDVTKLTVEKVVELIANKKKYLKKIKTNSSNAATKKTTDAVKKIIEKDEKPKKVIKPKKTATKNEK